MSDPYAATPEIVDDENDRPSTALEREGDAILERGAARPVNSLREAVREDVHDGREWITTRAARTREAVQDEPVRATLYALGLGVIVGLILSR